MRTPSTPNNSEWPTTKPSDVSLPTLVGNVSDGKVVAKYLKLKTDAALLKQECSLKKSELASRKLDAVTYKKAVDSSETRAERKIHNTVFVNNQIEIAALEQKESELEKIREELRAIEHENSQLFPKKRNFDIQ